MRIAALNGSDYSKIPNYFNEEFPDLPLSPLNYEDNATALIIGVGLMGQHMASNIIPWLNLKKLILVDHSSQTNGRRLSVILDNSTQVVNSLMLPINFRQCHLAF